MYAPTKTVSRKVDERTNKHTQGLGEPTLNLLGKSIDKAEAKNTPELCLENFTKNHLPPHWRNNSKTEERKEYFPGIIKIPN